MFKKFFGAGLLLLLFGAFAKADQVLDTFGPTSVVSAGGGAFTQISTSAVSMRNCLTEFDISVSSNAILRILDGNTTTYAIDLSTSASISGTTTVPPYTRSWPTDNPFCASYNSALNYTVSYSTGAGVAPLYTVPFKINYRGQIRGSR